MSRILLSAYCCIPNGGSEYDIGWNWVKCVAASGHEVTVFTRTFDRNRIEAALGSEKGVQFVFHDLPPFLQRLYRLPFGNYVYYLLWQHTAARRAAELHTAKKFDQVQHITWGSFRVPSFMGKLGIPFVFGPVGGGEDTPRRLRGGLGWRGRTKDALRRISNSLLSIDPLMRSTYKSAREILVTTPETLEKIPRKYRWKARVQPAVGIDAGNTRHKSTNVAFGYGRTKRKKMRALYAGRLLPWKGLHLALRAIAKACAGGQHVELTLIGSGPDEARLKRLAQRLGVGECVRWVPRVTRAELLRILSDFDVLLFPSLHDSGGMVVLEALSCGLPVICLDLGGPSLFVDQSCGRVVSTTAQDERGVVEQIAKFLSELATDRNLLEQLSESARQRAHSFTWETHVRAVYAESPLALVD
jgi:glycosyltransferase involved in cell wall biosynthesis